MIQSGKNWACAALALSFLVALSACNGGTALPEGLSAPGQNNNAGAGNAAGQLEPLQLSVVGFVGGEAPGSQTTEVKSPRAKANSSSGALAGANGLDLKDAAWNNLFSSGLSTTTLPASSNPTIRFVAAGSDTALNTVSIGQSGLYNTAFDARTLRTGTNLILEMEVNGTTSSIALPVLTVDDGDQVGFNAIRRLDGSLIVELFVDSVNNETESGIPDGRADNGLRVIVDNGFDIDGDNVRDTIARMDSIDGLSVFDLNLDGRFGDPTADGLTYIDTNNDNYSETPLHLATDEQRNLANKPEAIALLIDSELDGFRDAEAKRVLGNGSAADFISEALVSLAPARLSANGINTATARVELRPTKQGLPFNSNIRFDLTRTGGTLVEGSDRGEAQFVSNKAQTIERLVDPSDPSVRLFFNGKIVLTETLVGPLLQPASVDAATKLTLSTTILESNHAAISNDLPLDRSMAPLISNVAFNGQNDFSQVMGGLSATSTAARLVWGDRLEITGQNFSTVASANTVTIGGTLASDVSVNASGTLLTVDIAEGTTSGSVSVVVGGFGGKSSQDLILAGRPFEVESMSPSGETVPSNSTFALTMTRPVDAATLGAGISIVDANDTDLGWSAALASDGKTINLTMGTGTALANASTYRIRITSDLAAADAVPLLRYDPIRNTQLTANPEVDTSRSFTAMAPDNTPPTLLTNVPQNSDTNVDIRSNLLFTFSEAMSVATIVSAYESGTLKLADNSNPNSGTNAVPFDWALTADQRNMTITPKAPLKGNTNFTMTLPALVDPLRDVAGNGIEPMVNGTSTDIQIGFTTGLGVFDISPRSGPVGTIITVTGGDFTTAQDLSVTIGGISAVATLITPTSFEAIVPDGGESYTGGALRVSVNDEIADAPNDFTVTLMLRTVNLVGDAGSAPIGLAMSRDNNTLYVSNQGNGSVASYDLDSLRLLDGDKNQLNGVAPLTVGRVPSEAILSRDGKFLLALDYGTPESPGDSFFIIKRDEHIQGAMEIESTIGVGLRPTRIATSPDGSRWYVTNNASDTVSVVSAESPFQVLSQIPTGEGPNGIEISPDGTRGYVCNFTAGTVTIFDTASLEAVGEVAVGAGPARAKVSPDGRFVLVTCHGDQSVHFLDVANNNNLGSSPVVPEPSAMAFGRNGQDVYITSRRNDVVGRYSMSVSNNAPSLTESAFIQSARTPSGVLISNDGSRMIVSNEGAGFPQVIFLEAPAQTIERITRIGGNETTIADRGEILEIHGANFDPVAENNMVTFNGASASPDPMNSNESTLRVRIPEAATSGPLVVRIGDRESSPVGFSISPRIPRVTRTTPSHASIGVNADIQISVVFNEPIVATNADVRLRRGLDSITNGSRDIDPAAIGGTVTTRDFGRVLVFTPSAALTENPGSNNIYFFDVFNTIQDQAGNRLESARSFSFQLADTLGPVLLAATFIDVDNNGVDQGDVVNFVFDEPLGSSALPHVIGTDGSSVGFTDASTLGTDATFETPNLALLERTSPPNELDDLNRTIMVRLGAAPSLIVPGSGPGRTAINAITNFATDGISDAAGNSISGLSSATIDVGIALASPGTPQMLSAVLLEDAGNDSIGQAGDVIALYTNQPLTLLNPLSALDFIVGGAGASLGGSPTIALDPSNARVIRITLGTGANFDFNNGSGHTLTSPTGITNAVSFLDVPLEGWSSIVYSVGESTTGPRIETGPNAITLRDIDNNGIDAGDVIEVRMDAEVTVGSAPAALCFTHPVIGNDFGNNAFIRGSQNLALTQQERARTVEIVLGPNAKLLPAGTYVVGEHGFGLPSGIDVQATIPQWAVADVFGNSALPNLNGGSDVGSSDQSAPNFVKAVYRDENNNGTVDAGDAIIIIFDEPILRNGVTPSHFRIEHPTLFDLDLGTGATIAYGPNKPVNGELIQNNSLRLTLGQGTTVLADSGILLSTATDNPLSDASGNEMLPGVSTPLDLNLPEVPSPLLALIHDSNANGQADSGDLIWVKFDQAVNIASSNPENVFNLINPGATFGNSAFMSVATVDAALAATGMTARPINDTDPQIVTITLGANPILPDIAGIAPEFEFNYATSMANLNLSASTPVGIAMQPGKGVAFSGADLAMAFSDSTQTGGPNRFEGISMNIGLSGSGTAQDMIDLEFSLPGGLTRFVPIDSHFERLASAMNATFRQSSRAYRAFYNASSQELVVVSNQMSLAIDSIFVNQGDSFSTAATSFATLNDTPIRAAGATGFEARGSVDLGGMLSSGGGGGGNDGPTLSGALRDGSSLELFFSTPVVGNVSHSVDAVFSLPVSGDSFGTGATWEFLNGGVLIVLGSGAVITDEGTFSEGVTSTGAPSGIQVRSDAPSGSVTNVSGDLAQDNAVDIEGFSVSVGPAMVSATFNPLDDTISVLFDQNISYDPSTQVDVIFELPVVGDSFGFGSGSPRLLPQTGSNEILILVDAPTSTFNFTGIFDSLNTSAGSPSGISINPNVTSGDVAGGTPPEITTIDIESSGPPPVSLTVLLSSANSPDIELAPTPTPLVMIELQGDQNAAIDYDAIAFSAMSTSSFDMTELATQWALYFDSDASGSFDGQIDTIMSIGTPSGGQIVFNASFNALQANGTHRLFVVMIGNTNPSLAGTSFTLQLESIVAVQSGTAQPATVSGLPAQGPQHSFESNVPSMTTNFAGQASVGMAPAAGSFLFDRAAVGTSQAPESYNVRSIVSSAVIAANTVADISNTTISVQLDFNGSSMPLSMPASVGTSPEAKTHAIMLVVQEFIEFSDMSSTFGCWVDTNGDLVLGGHEASTQLLFDDVGTFNEITIGSKIDFASQSVWGDLEYSLFFGGSDGLAVSSLMDVYAENQDDGAVSPVSVGIFPDPIEGFPTARQGAAMAIDDLGVIYLHGGTTGSTVLSDLWTLSPIYSRQIIGQASIGVAKEALEALQWRKLNTSGGSARVNHTLQFVRGSRVAHSAGLVALGGKDGADNVLSIVEYFEPRSGSWTTITAQSGAPVGLHNHLSGYDPVEDVLVAAGGATDSSESQASTQVYVYAFEGLGTMHHSNITVSGDVPQTLIGSAGAFDDEDRELFFIGGQDENGLPSPSLAVLAFDSEYFSAQWLTIETNNSPNFSRTSASAAVMDSTILYGFGRDESFIADGIVFPVDFGSFGADSDFNGEILGAYFTAMTGQTSDIDAGESLTIRFAGPTNLLDIYPTGMLDAAEINDHLLISGATVPTSSTAMVISENFSADTLRIAFGSSATLSGTPTIDFQPNGSSPQAIFVDGSTLVLSQSEVFGSVDHNEFFVWTGTSPNYFDPQNWDQGVVPTNNAVVLIPKNALGVFASSLSVGQPNDISIRQLIVIGAQFEAEATVDFSTIDPNGVTGILNLGGRVDIANARFFCPAHDATVIAAGDVSIAELSVESEVGAANGLKFGGTLRIKDSAETLDDGFGVPTIRGISQMSSLLEFDPSFSSVNQGNFAVDAISFLGSSSFIMNGETLEVGSFIAEEGSISLGFDTEMRFTDEIYLGPFASFTTTGNGAVKIAPSCSSIQIPGLTGSDIEFEGYTSTISAGFESGFGAFSPFGSVGPGSAGTGRDGVGVSMESTGQTDELFAMGVIVGDDLEEAVLRFSVLTTGSASIDVLAYEAGGFTPIVFKTFDVDFGNGEIAPNVWNDFTLPFTVPDSRTLDIAITINNNFSTTFVDNVEIISYHRISSSVENPNFFAFAPSSFEVQNAYVDFSGVGVTSTISNDLADSATDSFSGAAMVFDSGSDLTLTGTSEIPRGLSITMTNEGVQGGEFDWASSGSKTLEGSLRLRKIDFSGVNGDPISVETGASLVLENNLVSDTTFDIADSDPTTNAPSAVRLDLFDVGFSGLASASINGSPTDAFILLRESGDTVVDYAFFEGIYYLTGPGPALLSSVSSTLNESFFVFAHGGSFNADYEDDPSSTGSSEEATGNIIWLGADFLSAVNLQADGQLANSGALPLTPGLGNFALGGLSLNPISSDAEIDSITIDIFSNIDDSVGPFDNMRIIMDDGDGSFDAGFDTTVLTTVAAAGSDDPSIMATFTPELISTPTVIWFVADIPANIQEGSRFSIALSTTSVGATYPQSPVSDAPVIQQFTVGGVAATTITDAWNDYPGNTMLGGPDSSLTILGSNLQGATIHSVVAVDDFDQTSALAGTPVISADGRFITGIDLDSSPQDFRVRVSLTPAGGGGTLNFDIAVQFSSP